MSLEQELKYFKDKFWEDLIQLDEGRDTAKELCQRGLFHYGTRSSSYGTNKGTITYSCHNCDKTLVVNYEMQKG